MNQHYFCHDLLECLYILFFCTHVAYSSIFDDQNDRIFLKKINLLFASKCRHTLGTELPHSLAWYHSSEYSSQKLGLYWVNSTTRIGEPIKAMTRRNQKRPDTTHQ